MLYKNKSKPIIGTFLAGLGFILSPLTWWNDMLVNLPLAFAFAYLVGYVLSLAVPVNVTLFLGLTAIGYFLTNVVGFLLMQHGYGQMRGKRNKVKFCWRKNLAYSALAFGLVVICMQVGLLDLGEAQQLKASILQVPYLD